MCKAKSRRNRDILDKEVVNFFKYIGYLYLGALGPTLSFGAQNLGPLLGGKTKDFVFFCFYLFIKTPMSEMCLGTKICWLIEIWNGSSPFILWKKKRSLSCKIKSTTTRFFPKLKKYKNDLTFNLNCSLRGNLIIKF